MTNLGRTYQKIKKYQTALQYYMASCEIGQEIGDRNIEGANLFNIGEVYELREDYDLAIDYFEQSLTVHLALGAKHRIEQTQQSLKKVRALRDEANRGE